MLVKFVHAAIVERSPNALEHLVQPGEVEGQAQGIVHNLCQTYPDSTKDID